MIVAIDGGKRVGYCLFTWDGKEVERGVIEFDHFFNWFFIDQGYDLCFAAPIRSSTVHRINQLVVEGFRHNPNVNQGGSLHWASQVEGGVKMLGRVSGVPVKVQYSAILPVSMMHAGYDPPKTKTGKKKHLPDQDSAFLHGHYFLVGQGIL